MQPRAPFLVCACVPIVEVVEVVEVVGVVGVASHFQRNLRSRVLSTTALVALLDRLLTHGSFDRAIPAVPLALSRLW